MHAVMGRAYTAAMASIPSSNPARGAPRSLTGLLPFLRPYRIHILLSGVFLVLAALATLAFPMALRGLIDGGLVGGSASDKGAQAMALRGHFEALFAVAVALGVFSPPRKYEFAPNNSVDMVLTFRNIHNWIPTGPDNLKALFTSVYDSLKPGGVFGVVEHRLPASKTQDATASSGLPVSNSSALAVKAAEMVFICFSCVDAG